MKTVYDMPMLWLSKEKATMQKGQKRTAAPGQRPDLVLASPLLQQRTPRLLLFALSLAAARPALPLSLIHI